MRDATAAGLFAVSSNSGGAQQSSHRTYSTDGPRTLFGKIWDNHVVHSLSDDGSALIYIDRHLVHEVTSPQAFEGLRAAGR
jgi:hypothetical protein